VILDTDGNIFGGFSPVAWESGIWHSKADPGAKSFLFILKNPHGLSPRKVPLKQDGRALVCETDQDPSFFDHGVADRWNEGANN
jgi:hypothetical protein